MSRGGTEVIKPFLLKFQVSAAKQDLFLFTISVEDEMSSMGRSRILVRLGTHINDDINIM